MIFWWRHRNREQRGEQKEKNSDRVTFGFRRRGALSLSLNLLDLSSPLLTFPLALQNDRKRTHPPPQRARPGPGGEICCCFVPSGSLSPLDPFFSVLTPSLFSSLPLNSFPPTTTPQLALCLIQSTLVWWKKTHRRSYELVSLLGLWLVPAAISAR